MGAQDGVTAVFYRFYHRQERWFETEDEAIDFLLDGWSGPVEDGLSPLRVTRSDGSTVEKVDLWEMLHARTEMAVAR